MNMVSFVQASGTSPRRYPDGSATDLLPHCQALSMLSHAYQPLPTISCEYHD
jgi:hypothetical protein